MDDLTRCAACGGPVSYMDECGCVGTDPAYHFRAECLLEATRRAEQAVDALIAVRDGHIVPDHTEDGVPVLLDLRTEPATLVDPRNLGRQ